MTKLRKLIMPLMAMLFVFSSVSCGDDDDDNGGVSSDFIVGKTSITFAASGGDQEVAVQSPSAVTMTPAESWVKVSPKSVSSNVYKFTISADANLSGDERKTTIAVSAGANTASIEVSQAVGDVVAIDAGSKSFTIAKDGGTITVKFKHSGEYSSKITVPWISKPVSKAMVDGSESFVVSSNTLTRDRIGYIIYSSKDNIDTVTVVQEKGAESESLPYGATAMEIAKNMYPGWNLGNTMEASGGETSWQSTKTTQEIIDYVKSLGFRSVRIPCSWYIHCTKSGDYTIDASWMARVKEVVDYCINDDLYVVLNDHYDGDWIEESGFKDITASKVDELCGIMGNLWTQIANEFKDYDNHLLFAGLNEPFHSNNSSSVEEKVATLVKYEQAFVDAVRATGGNNASRILVVQGPATDIDLTLKHYNTLPTDNVKDAMMVEVHYYTPWNFCGMEANESWGSMFFYWGNENHLTGSSYNANWGEVDMMKDYFEKMRASFADKGYPIIIGEYACQWRDLSSLSSESQEKHNASVKAFYKAVSQYGPENGMIPMTWDINYCNNGGTKGTMTLIDRNSLEVFNTFAMEGIQEGNAAAVWMK